MLYDSYCHDNHKHVSLAIKLTLIFHCLLLKLSPEFPLKKLKPDQFQKQGTVRQSFSRL